MVSEEQKGQLFFLIVSFDFMDLTSSRSIVTKSYRFAGVKFGFGDLFDGSCYLQGSSVLY